MRRNRFRIALQLAYNVCAHTVSHELHTLHIAVLTFSVTLPTRVVHVAATVSQIVAS